jgi:hypothetical protein
MNQEILIFDQLRARLDAILYQKYLLLYGVLKFYSNEDLLILYRLHQFDSEGKEHFRTYPETRAYLNTVIAVNRRSPVPPCPSGSWGMMAIPLQIAIRVFKTGLQSLASEEQVEQLLQAGQIPDFLGWYFKDPDDISEMWKIFTEFQVEVENLIRKQLPLANH